MPEEVSAKEEKIKISVITATYNAAKELPNLIQSLRLQTDRDFEWVIADGGSSDDTLKMINSVRDLRVRVSTQSDFGIYDALNRGVKNSNGDYYVVVGADDILFKDAIAKYKKYAKKENGGAYDFVAAGYKIEKNTKYPMKNKGWLYGMLGEASSHSVSLLIKKEVHSHYGYYSRSFPICADQLFVRTALKGGASINRASFIAGEYGMQGFSAQDSAGILSELFRVQLKVGENKLFQLLIYIARMLKNYRSL